MTEATAEKKEMFTANLVASTCQLKSRQHLMKSRKNLKR